MKSVLFLLISVLLFCNFPAYGVEHRFQPGPGVALSLRAPASWIAAAKTRSFPKERRFLWELALSGSRTFCLVELYWQTLSGNPFGPEQAVQAAYRELKPLLLYAEGEPQLQLYTANGRRGWSFTVVDTRWKAGTPDDYRVMTAIYIWTNGMLLRGVVQADQTGGADYRSALAVISSLTAVCSNGQTNRTAD